MSGTQKIHFHLPAATNGGAVHIYFGDNAEPVLAAIAALSAKVTKMSDATQAQLDQLMSDEVALKAQLDAAPAAIATMVAAALAQAKNEGATPEQLAGFQALHLALQGDISNLKTDLNPDPNAAGLPPAPNTGAPGTTADTTGGAAAGGAVSGADTTGGAASGADTMGGAASGADTPVDSGSGTSSPGGAAADGTA